MQYEIGYILVYDYYKSSQGQGSWRPHVTHRSFLEWDGTESFEDLIKRQHPEFVTEAEDADERPGSDRNHRIEVCTVRIGGEKSQAILSVEKQIFYLKKDIIVEA